NDEEPSPQRIAYLINLARNYNIKTMFIEPEYNIQQMQSIASQVNAKVLTVNDLDENYLQNMKNVAEAFSQV
ncbi:MAG: zinc ABC transporter substrate-binding protein, partial [Methanobacterium paludis]|nr:zinc ABC transporter substrate-binding protein [Methanobacterium paludis]